MTSDPNCTLNTITGNNILMENDYVQMQCFVRFVGDLVPVMKLRREGQLIDGAKTYITKPPVGNQYTVTTSFSVQVNFMDNGVRFSCDAFFTPKVYNNSSDEFLIKAKNAPDNTYTWMSPPIYVSYGSRNLRILFSNESNEDCLFTVSDDHLECYADGNPTPRYEWTIETKHVDITVLYLNESMFSNQQFAVECKAVNDFGEQTGRIVIKRPIVNATECIAHSSICVPYTVWTIIAIVIIGITNITSITACIALIVKKRMKEGVTLVVTDTTATTSSIEYAELQDYTTPRHMPNYANNDLQEETAYTDLKVSRRQHQQSIIYTNQQ